MASVVTSTGRRCAPTERALLSAGEVPPDLPAEEAAAILLATIEGLLIRGLTDPALDVPALVRLAVLRIFGR